MPVKWMALVVGALGVAAFVTCTPPEGKPCATHDECALEEYCEPQLGACVRWSPEDPSCRPACPQNRYCSHGLCYSRFSAVTITSPAPGTVTGPHFDASFTVTPAGGAPDSGMVPYIAATRILFESTGSSSSFTGPVPSLEHTYSVGPLSVDASVLLTVSLDNTGLTSAPVRVFIDQTFDAGP